MKGESLECQLLYSRQVRRLLPARAASWYLLESPHTSRHSWACAPCGQKWGGCAKQRILVVKVNCLVSTVDFHHQDPLFCTPAPFLATAGTSPQLENQMGLQRLVNVARKLTPGEPSAEDILAVIGELDRNVPRIDLAALQQIIHLAASTCGFGSSPPARRYWQNEEEGLGPFDP